MSGIATSRRDFIRAAGLALLAAAPPRPLLAQATAPAAGRTRLVLLGTAGGPRPTPGFGGKPAQVVIANGVPYVVDCGSGVAQALVQAGVRLPQLRHVLITHHHSDHNLDYGNLIYQAWVSGLRTRVDCWGPPPLERMTRLYFELNAYDIDTRIADEGRPDPRPLVRVHEYDKPGLVLQDENVKVTAALVEHPPVVPAFAYRFDAADRSIVISGDTTRSDALVELARGADVLVHEVMYLPGIDKLLQRNPNAARLREHLLASHTTTEDVGRVAAAAGVKTLVLPHLVPADGEVTPEQWTDGVRKHFSGQVILGRDLLEI
jgi:ribonuclease BN (tRNA processing enzyme)